MNDDGSLTSSDSVTWSWFHLWSWIHGWGGTMFQLTRCTGKIDYGTRERLLGKGKRKEENQYSEQLLRVGAVICSPCPQTGFRSKRLSPVLLTNHRGPEWGLSMHDIFKAEGGINVRWDFRYQQQSLWVFISFNTKSEMKEQSHLNFWPLELSNYSSLTINDHYRSGHSNDPLFPVSVAGGKPDCFTTSS